MFKGQVANTGTCVSFTVTLNEHSVVFPFTSVAENVLVVTPVGKAEPLGKPAVCTTTKPGQLSVAVGAAHVATAVH